MLKIKLVWEDETEDGETQIYTRTQPNGNACDSGDVASLLAGAIRAIGCPRPWSIAASWIEFGDDDMDLPSTEASQALYRAATDYLKEWEKFDKK